MSNRDRRILTVTAAVLLGWSLHVSAQSPESTTQIDMPAQPLAQAIQAVARQASINILVDPRLVEGREAPAVKAQLSIHQALNLLLRGTGLTPRFVDDKTITLVAGAGSAPVKTSATAARTAAPVRLAHAGAADTSQDRSAASAQDAKTDEPASQSAGSSALEEIVVTARKRSESLQEVPSSVSAIQGAELSRAGIENVENLYGQIPNLFAVVNGQNVASDSVYLMIRGVGFNGGQEPATGVFVDGVYQPQIGFDIGFLDLERLEVLRGPQGTLYGRNTQAGALNLVTKKPGETFEGKFEGEAGEFGTYRAQASVRGPLAGNFFGGLSAEYGQADGYLKKAGSGGDRNPYERFTARGTLRWLPSEALEVNLSGDVSQKDYNDIGYGVPRSCKCYAVPEDEIEDHKNLYGGSLAIDWSISDSLTLTSITGSRAVDSDITLDFDLLGTPTAVGPVSGIPGSVLTPNTLLVSGSNYRTAFEQDIFSQELRLAGKVSEAFDYQVGAFYFDQSENYKRKWLTGPDTSTAPELAFFPPFYAYQDLNQDRDGWAVFGQASWRPLPKLELTLGGRYANETDSLSGESNARLETIDTTIINVFDGDVYSDSFNSFTGLGSVSYHLNDDVMTYLTVSQGWKSGGFNKLPEEFLQSYNDENSINYELGLKSTWFQNRALLNVAVFYIDITDQQLSGTVFIDNLPRATITNAGKSISQGFEVELTGRLTDRLTLSATLGYADTEFKQYTDSDGIVRDGQPFPNVPELTGSATLEYLQPLANGMELEFAANYIHIGSYTEWENSFGGFADVETPSSDRVDTQVSLVSKGWRFTGYVKNVFDSYDINNTTLADFFLPTLANAYVTPLPPRQFGLRVSKEF